MSAESESFGTIETRIPGRLDRLPWSRFHWRVVFGLGAVWILDGLEVTIVGSSRRRLVEKGSGIELTNADIGARRVDLHRRRLPRRALLRPAHRPFRPQEAVPADAAALHRRDRRDGLRVRALVLLLARFFTGAGIGGEYAAINSAIDELIPARVRGRVDLMINGSYWLGAAVGALAVADAARHGDLRARRRLAGRVRDRRHARPGDPDRPPPRPREPALAVHPRPRGGGRADRRRDRARRSRRDRRGARRARGRSDRGPPAQARSRSARSRGRRSAPTRSARPRACRCSSARRSSTTPSLSPRHDADDLLRRRRGKVASSTRVFAAGNFLGPLLLGRLFDTVGRKPMIAGSYLGSAALLVVARRPLRQRLARRLGASWRCCCVTFFFASAGASSAYLTVSEIFPMETRALAIAFFYAIGTAAGGITRPAALREAHPLPAMPVRWRSASSSALS